MNEKNLELKGYNNEKSSTFAAAKKVDSVAQQVEHNTFNVGVLGSSPSRVTNKQKISDQVGDFLLSLPT